MKRWSKLQSELYKVIDPTINFQIHCSVYRMGSRWGSSDLPRYFITLDNEIIFDYPKQFINEKKELKNLSRDSIAMTYPYNNDISDISDLFKEYLNTPKEELLDKHFHNDYWGLISELEKGVWKYFEREKEILRPKKL